MGRNNTKQKPWSESDILFMKENYGKIPIEEMVKKLGRSKSSIYSQAYKMKLDASHKLPKQLRDKIIKHPRAEQVQQQLIIEDEKPTATALNTYLSDLIKAYQERQQQNEKLHKEILKIQESLKVIELIK